MGQVAHFDVTEKLLELYVIKNALNDHLMPFPISILEVEKAHNDFHARFDATQRKYLYRIVNESRYSLLRREEHGKYAKTLMLI